MKTRISKHWNAGVTGCGQLIVGLKREIADVESGELLRVTALDAGAPEDIPAWCRMTGHELVSSEYPIFIVRRK